jgi:Ca2+-binding RTX toxin-like protein
MQSLTITSDYQVLASDWLRFTNQNGFVLSQPAQTLGEAPHLQIAGTVEVLRTALTDSAGVAALQVNNTFDSAPLVSIDVGGRLNVSALISGGVAFGYVANGMASPLLTNAGEIRVAGEAEATGIDTVANSSEVENSGQIAVSAGSGAAFGVRMGGYGMDLSNTGSIDVAGHGGVTGVEMIGSSQVFSNTGTITAHDDSDATVSIGVYWNNGVQPGEAASFVNDGRIEADNALVVDISSGAAADNLITNNGELVGGAYIGGGGAVTLVNNGDISGPIQLIGPGIVYDGRVGTALGTISGFNNPGGETFYGGVGAETISGLLGDDTIFGGAGDDRIDGGDGANYLRGEDGADWILGGADFDNVNGNKGDDTIDGGSGGGDWLLGGQGQDLVQAHSGSNILNGNLGDDTVGGGADADILRGGQGDDLITGGAGNDLLFGDIGQDTLTGGAGADIFNPIGWGGLELITDFSYSEGDRVQFGPAMFIHNISQSGNDVLLELWGTGQNSQVFSVYAGAFVRIENVQLSSLPADWIIQACGVNQKDRSGARPLRRLGVCEQNGKLGSCRLQFP